jgi:hypothetical protein
MCVSVVKVGLDDGSVWIELRYGSQVLSMCICPSGQWSCFGLDLVDWEQESGEKQVMDGRRGSISHSDTLAARQNSG